MLGGHAACALPDAVLAGGGMKPHESIDAAVLALIVVDGAEEVVDAIVGALEVADSARGRSAAERYGRGLGCSMGTATPSCGPGVSTVGFARAVGHRRTHDASLPYSRAFCARCGEARTRLSTRLGEA